LVRVSAYSLALARVNNVGGFWSIRISPSVLLFSD
jgi:hypothetical protein